MKGLTQMNFVGYFVVTAIITVTAYVLQILVSKKQKLKLTHHNMNIMRTNAVIIALVIDALII